MPTNISGLGMVGTRIEGYFVPLLASAFSASEEVTSNEAKGYSQTDCSILQTTDTVLSESTMTVTLGAQSIDDMEMAVLLFNRPWKESAAITVPNITGATIPSATPYEVTIAGITTDSQVDVTIVRDVAPGKEPMKRVTAAPAAIDEFQVSAGKLTFHSTAAGLRILIYTRQELTDLKTIGGTHPFERFENIEVFGKICTTRTASRKIWFPRCTSNTGLGFDPTGDAFTRELRALIPAELSFNHPFIVW